MKIILALSNSPVLILLAKWTALLGLAWIVDHLLRAKDARLRVILWRCVLCFGVALPLLQFFPISLYKVPVRAEPAAHQTSAIREGLTSSDAPQSHTENAAPFDGQRSASPETPQARTDTLRRPDQRSWHEIAVTIWGAGFLIAVLRLIRMQAQLAQLRRTSIPANRSIDGMVARIQEQLRVQRQADVRVSDLVKSPFLCGILKPMIVLPQELVRSVSERELTALLRHEMAHLRQRDLPWCIAWKGMAAVCWFHPLVWKVPTAHSLACEQEADRIASDQFADSGSYVQLLAQLALCVVLLPRTETSLTLNGASEIVRRIRHIQHGHTRIWKPCDSALGFGLAGVLILIAAGWEFSKGSAADFSKTRTFKEVTIQVTDEDGKPLEGATLQPYGFRVKGPDSPSHYNWNTFGARPQHKTDRDGKAEVTYPVEAFPEEKLFTGQLSFIVSHPDFGTRTAEISVDGETDRIELKRGIALEVSGYYGRNRQPVLELVPNVSGDPRPEWVKGANGVYRTGQLAPGGYLIQLTGKLPSGEIVYSEGHPFTAETGKRYDFALEMKPGIRVEGRIDERVPRPVKEGRVVVSVRPKEFPAFVVPEDLGALHGKYGYFQYWSSYRPIAPDGTFVFESVPPGEVDVIVHGEGFVSRNGGAPMNRIDSRLVSGLVIGVPQAFSLTAPTTKIEVITEPSATIELIAKTKKGEPVEDARVVLYPNVMRMQTGIFGDTKPSSEEPFHDIDPLPAISYSAVTDEHGTAVLKNIPAVARHLNIEHSHFEAPIQKGYGDRTIRFNVTPGETLKLEVILQPKGTEFLGSARMQ